MILLALLHKNPLTCRTLYYWIINKTNIRRVREMKTEEKLKFNLCSFVCFCKPTWICSLFPSQMNKLDIPTHRRWNFEWTTFWVQWVSEAVINGSCLSEQNPIPTIFNHWFLIKSTLKFKNKSENFVFQYGLKNTMFHCSTHRFLWFPFQNHLPSSKKNSGDSKLYILYFVSACSCTYRHLSTKTIVKTKA